MQVTIYHNPGCSKSRQTLAMLEKRGLRPTVVEYLAKPPSEDEIEHILRLLDKQPRELMRRQEAPYKANNLDDSKLTRRDLIRSMIADPILIERPIVVVAGKAAIGRPPEQVLEILGA